MVDCLDSLNPYSGWLAVDLAALQLGFGSSGVVRKEAAFVPSWDH